MEPVIKVQNVGKRYMIAHMRGKYIALRDVLTTVMRNPFSFLKTKAKQVTGLEKKEDFWALRHINFEVQRGEVVGIIGHNGAGKSTLLKILTGITPPTEGEIILNGRVSSLLEVGTGFHPELTGRENIFLNGAILGMTRKEIARKFDEIVEFAGIEKFLDTPVKYYSSGMYVRLAFSVAAHMEPDILLVDEVLAVGDAEFQKKCLGKMEEVTQGDGRTILFVSHNMNAIRRLCKKCILLEKGNVKMYDDTEKVIAEYLQDIALTSVQEFEEDMSKKASITRISIQNNNGQPTSQILINEPFSITVDFSIHEDIPKSIFSVYFYSNEDTLLLSSESDSTGQLVHYKPGTYSATVHIPAHTFNVGVYSFTASIHHPMIASVDIKENNYFEIRDSEFDSRSTIFAGYHAGPMAAILKYSITKKS